MTMAAAALCDALPILFPRQPVGERQLWDLKRELRRRQRDQAREELKANKRALDQAREDLDAAHLNGIDHEAQLRELHRARAELSQLKEEKMAVERDSNHLMR